MQLLAYILNSVFTQLDIAQAAHDCTLNTKHIAQAVEPDKIEGTSDYGPFQITYLMAQAS